MKKVPKQTLVAILKPYKTEQRFLQEARIGESKITGSFYIGCNSYAQPVSQITDVGIQYCINQLAYTLLYGRVRQEQMPITTGNFKKLQVETMLIIESKKRFRRKIIPPEVTGKLSIIKSRKNFYFGEFNFNEGSCIGEIIFQLGGKK